MIYIVLEFKYYSVEKIKNKVFESEELGGRYVAEIIRLEIERKASKGENFVLGLATGASPVSLYRELVKMHTEDGLSFKNVITFNLDEYYPIDPSSIQSYHRFMDDNFFNKVDIDRKNINIPDGTLGMDEISDFCQNYENRINDLGGIDIQILGIGRTGHIGFNEPGSSSRSFTRLVSLDKKTRRDASKAFKSIENVPRKAITMGVGTIFKSKKIFLFAWGEKKSEIVAKSIEGPITPLIPAAFLQNHNESVFIFIL